MDFRISIKEYKKRDGNLMLYINKYNNFNNSRLSVGISDKVFLTKLTKGERGLLNDFFNALDICSKSNEINFTKENFENHKEPKAELDFGIKILITDVADCGGVKTWSDGLFIAYNGKLLDTYTIKEYLENQLNGLNN